MKTDLRNSAYGALILVLLLGAAAANAVETFVDTGTPTAPKDPQVCHASECGEDRALAGKFTLASTATLTSVSIFIYEKSFGSDVTVSLRANSGGLPGAVLKSTTMLNEPFPFVTPPGYSWRSATVGWMVLNPGDYWLTVEPQPGFDGTMGNDAPAPLASYAEYYGGAWALWPDSPFPYDNHIGFRVLGEFGVLDFDLDGVADNVDNCVVVANANQANSDSDFSGDACDTCRLLTNFAQCDSDTDGFGNACDGDLNNNGSTNAQDTVLFRQQLGQPSVAPAYNEADLNCSGAVNAQDTTLFRQRLGSPPGPGAAP